MADNNTSVAVVPLAVAMNSSAVANITFHTSDTPLQDAAGNQYTLRIASEGASGDTQYLRTQNLTRITFSSVPVVLQPELVASYRDLGEALNDLTEMDDDGWKVNQNVYEVATHVAADLLATGIPAPKVFSHGEKSVVFNWSGGPYNLYLTISSDFVSALVSTPQKIQRRLRFASQTLIGSKLISGLLMLQSKRPFIARGSSSISSTNE